MISLFVLRISFLTLGRFLLRYLYVCLVTDLERLVFACLCRGLILFGNLPRGFDAGGLSNLNQYTTSYAILDRSLSTLGKHLIKFIYRPSFSAHLVLPF